MIGLLVVQACDQEVAQKPYPEQAKKEQEAKERKRQREAQKEAECAIVVEALAVASLRGREDLVDPLKGSKQCHRIYIEECPYKVELLYELGKAARRDLVEKVAKIGFEDCSEEFRFAEKYSIEAFRDHRKLLEAAVEEALSEERDSAQDERDYR